MARPRANNLDALLDQREDEHLEEHYTRAIRYYTISYWFSIAFAVIGFVMFAISLFSLTGEDLGGLERELADAKQAINEAEQAKDAASSASQVTSERLGDAKTAEEKASEAIEQAEGQLARVEEERDAFKDARLDLPGELEELADELGLRIAQPGVPTLLDRSGLGLDDRLEIRSQVRSLAEGRDASPEGLIPYFSDGDRVLNEIWNAVQSGLRDYRWIIEEVERIGSDRIQDPSMPPDEQGVPGAVDQPPDQAAGTQGEMVDELNETLGSFSDAFYELAVNPIGRGVHPDQIRARLAEEAEKARVMEIDEALGRVLPTAMLEDMRDSLGRGPAATPPTGGLLTAMIHSFIARSEPLSEILRRVDPLRFPPAEGADRQTPTPAPGPDPEILGALRRHLEGLAESERTNLFFRVQNWELRRALSRTDQLISIFEFLDDGDRPSDAPVAERAGEFARSLEGLVGRQRLVASYSPRWVRTFQSSGGIAYTMADSRAGTDFQSVKLPPAPTPAPGYEQVFPPYVEAESVPSPPVSDEPALPVVPFADEPDLQAPPVPGTEDEAPEIPGDPEASEIPDDEAHSPKAPQPEPVAELAHLEENVDPVAWASQKLEMLDFLALYARACEVSDRVGPAMRQGVSSRSAPVDLPPEFPKLLTLLASGSPSAAPGRGGPGGKPGGSRDGSRVEVVEALGRFLRGNFSPPSVGLNYGPLSSDGLRRFFVLYQYLSPGPARAALGGADDPEGYYFPQSGLPLFLMRADGMDPAQSRRQERDYVEQILAEVHQLLHAIGDRDQAAETLRALVDLIAVPHEEQEPAYRLAGMIEQAPEVFDAVVDEVVATRVDATQLQREALDEILVPFGLARQKELERRTAEVTEKKAELTRAREDRNAILDRINDETDAQARADRAKEEADATLGRLRDEERQVADRIEARRSEQRDFMAEHGTALLGGIAAVIIEIVAGLFFVVSNRTQQDVNQLLNRVREDRRIRQAILIARGIDDPAYQNWTQATLALGMASISPNGSIALPIPRDAPRVEGEAG
ncbi:hypothetical protein [Tautonia plasticadhaerens]|uniref:Uncharacterized protein n=1 Tax=Tautonia plasticadhaerens TaxID=2527974 RepID=A0A518HBS0_9BACT|nr:hypothetical protein [Tautonia plasticadhaerens]QDV38302.1 hypothetical protein ElP_62530 [Tautonia plasticadhaerens]